MTTPPGWYPDPEPTAAPGTERRWAGNAWTHDVRLPAPLPPPAPPQVAPRPRMPAPPQIRPCKDNQVLVWKLQLERGDLPNLCVLTGLPATTTQEKQVQYVPGWAAYLFVLRLFLARRVKARVPLSSVALRRIKMQTAGAVGVVVLAMVALVTGFTLMSVPVVVVAVLLIVVAMVLAVLGSTWLPVWVSDDEQVVQLTKVHPAFARAVRQQQGLPS